MLRPLAAAAADLSCLRAVSSQGRVRTQDESRCTMEVPTNDKVAQGQALAYVRGRRRSQSPARESSQQNPSSSDSAPGAENTAARILDALAEQAPRAGSEPGDHSIGCWKNAPGPKESADADLASRSDSEPGARNFAVREPDAPRPLAGAPKSRRYPSKMKPKEPAFSPVVEADFSPAADDADGSGDSVTGIVRSSQSFPSRPPIAAMSFDSRPVFGAERPPASSSSFQADFPLTKAELAEFAQMANDAQEDTPEHSFLSLPEPEGGAPPNSTLPMPMAPEGSIWRLRSGEISSINSVDELSTRSTSRNKSYVRRSGSDRSHSPCGSVSSVIFKAERQSSFDEALISSVKGSDEEDVLRKSPGS